MSDLRNKLAASVFLANNQALDTEPKYNAEVQKLAAQIVAGEISPEDAELEAIGALVDEVFPSGIVVR